VVLEACYGWYWAADALAEAGAEVHLAHPLGVKAFSQRRVKNDELDARDLADLLRMGRLPEAWIPPAEIRELREITRYRPLCRCRHRVRYAEARIMPSGRERCRPRVVAAVKTSA
jgi:transposase